MIIPAHLGNTTKEIVQALHLKWNIDVSRELKGSDLNNQMRYFIGQQISELLGKEPSIRIRVVVIKKAKVPALMRDESFDILRNHLIYLGVKNTLAKADQVFFYPDYNPTKKMKLDAAKDYLTSRIWFDHHQMININYEPKDSCGNFNLIFIDWISNTFWRYFENDITSGYDTLKEHVEIVHLNF